VSKNAWQIQVENVSKSYSLGSTQVWALRDVSLNLAQGEILALCGSSGSGKTTLLNLIGCLTAPTSGKISIGGRDVSGLSDEELSAFRAKSFGFVFQNFNLLPVLSALENVEYALLGFPLTRAERREKAVAALKLVGLAEVEKHRPDQLSGGQRQRVAIARAFVHSPALIIADEPTANLDKKTAGEILDLMVSLNGTTGSSVIIATHDPIAMARARRKIEISDGKIL
jgi:putative ABC transport system ATP-binding protein